MNKSKKLQGIFIAVLAFVMVGMSVGFAAYTRQLTISGTTTVGQNKWSVHFTSAGLTANQNGQPTESVPVISEKDTTATITATLTKIGDSYEAIIPVTNDGTFNAKLSSAVVTDIEAEQKKIVKYTVSFDGNLIYDSSRDTSLNKGQNLTYALNIGEKKNLVVKLEYIQPKLPEELPTAGAASIATTVALTFTQAD